MNKFIGLFLLFTFLAACSYAQQSTVNGQVTASKTGTPLNGVVVRTSKQAVDITNENGDFAIHAEKGDSITFTYVGYEQQLIYLTNPELPVIISLERKGGKLNDIVVTGLKMTMIKKR